MATGISMSSINRIKELAAAREYKRALGVVRTQELDLSYNPEFLRLCGEIFIETECFDDARKYLVKAHKMAPQGNRIIFELIRLYLLMGFYKKADIYRQQYELNAIEDDGNKEIIKYMFMKAERKSADELIAVLQPVDDMYKGDKWTYELIALYLVAGNKVKAEEEYRYLVDHYKDSTFIKNADDLMKLEQVDSSLIYIYPEHEIEEEDIDSEIAIEEDDILKKDYLRIHPKDPEIMMMADDNDEDITIRLAFPFGRKKNEDVEDKKASEDSTEGMNEASEEQTSSDSESQEKKDEASGESAMSKIFGFFKKKDTNATESKSENTESADTTESVEAEKKPESEMSPLELAAKKAAEEEAEKKAAKEASEKAIEEATKKAAEEEAARKAAEEEAARKAAEEAAKKAAEEEAAKKAAEEAAKKVAEEEAARKIAEELENSQNKVIDEDGDDITVDDEMSNPSAEFVQSVSTPDASEIAMNEMLEKEAALQRELEMMLQSMMAPTTSVIESDTKTSEKISEENSLNDSKNIDSKEDESEAVEEEVLDKKALKAQKKAQKKAEKEQRKLMKKKKNTTDEVEDEDQSPNIEAKDLFAKATVAEASDRDIDLYPLKNERKGARKEMKEALIITEEKKELIRKLKER